MPAPQAVFSAGQAVDTQAFAIRHDHRASPTDELFRAHRSAGSVFGIKQTCCNIDHDFICGRKEFASPALNKHKAMDVIWEIASRYNLMDF